MKFFGHLPITFDNLIEHISSIVEWWAAKGTPAKDLRLIEWVPVIQENVEN
jgi:hypothetical protein